MDRSTTENASLKLALSERDRRIQALESFASTNNTNPYPTPWHGSSTLVMKRHLSASILILMPPPNISPGRCWVQDCKKSYFCVVTT